MSETAKELREYADYRATPDALSRLLWHAADQIDASGEWQPIETAPRETEVLLWSPPENLSHEPNQKPDVRVSTTRNWCWATHWMPLPNPPQPSPPRQRNGRHMSETQTSFEIRRIKPLEWVQARVSDKWERYSANSIVGRYEALEWSGGGYGGTLAPTSEDEQGVEFSAATLDAAKQICQHDFEQRIYSVIEWV